MNRVFASVAPVLMVMLIGVVLPTQAETFGGRVWLGITTVRVLRKVSSLLLWQYILNLDMPIVISLPCFRSGSVQGMLCLN